MNAAAERDVDALVRDARTWDATRAVDAARAATDDPDVRRLAAGAYGLAGRGAALAGVAEPALVAAKSSDDVERWLATLPNGPTAFDHVAAAAATAWRGDADAAYGLLRSAATVALQSQAPHVAVAVNERLALLALSFAHVAIAQRAIAAATHVATTQRLSNWRRRCSTTAARLAFAAGDATHAAALVADARSTSSPETAALIAPIAAALATNDAATSPVDADDLRVIALTHETPDVAACAAIGWALAESPPDGSPSPASPALRRAVLRGSDGVDTIECFSVVARLGDVEDARIATATLLAIASANVPLADAHALLARAYVLFRTGRNDEAAGAAGDAARAFASAGLRGWTNEAMLLLVRHEGDASQARRRPSALSLTGRERQVAQLVRRGSSNRDVARVLDISEHTVERHVSSILSRLGLRSRWQLVDRRTDEF